MNTRTTLLVLLFTGSIALNAYSEVAGRPWLAKADKNGDGAVSVEEAQMAEEIWLKNQQPKPPIENVKEKREEIKERIQEKREEKREDWKEQHPDKPLPPGLDKDNNPPGMAGGPGTGPHMDHDNNPPGMAGGPGTNWENKPGPQGGPGAGPDRGHRGGDGPKPGNGGGFAKKKR